MKCIEVLVHNKRHQAIWTESAYRFSLVKMILSETNNYIFQNILHKMNQQGIFLGTEYGSNGITVDQALTRSKTDIVLELGPEIIARESVAKVKYILENYIVILSDIFESGLRFFGMLQYLKDNNISPRLGLLVGSNIHMLGAPEHNIHHCDLNIWPLLCAYLNSNLTNALLASTHRNEQAQLIRNCSRPEFCFFPNRKARANRVKMLSLLNDRGILKNIHWSLDFYFFTDWTKQIPESIRGNHIELARTLIRPNREYGENAQILFDNVIDEIDSMLSRREKDFLNSLSLPKFIESDDQILQGAGIRHGQRPAMNLPAGIGSYIWNIVGETCVEVYNTDFGQYSHITEKSYKSFYLGSLPIILGTVGMESRLREKGFQIPESAHDNLSGHARMESMCDYLKNLHHEQNTHTDIRVENFLRATDLQWVVSEIVDPLTMLHR